MNEEVIYPDSLTGDQLAGLLRRLARHVESGSSKEGSIAYHASPHEPGIFHVVVTARIGQQDGGQGGALAIGTHLPPHSLN